MRAANHDAVGTPGPAAITPSTETSSSHSGFHHLALDVKKKAERAPIDISSYAEHVYLGPDAPTFPEETYDIVKQDLLQSKAGGTTKFYALELHAATDQLGSMFRVFTHTGVTANLNVGGTGGEKRFRMANSFEEAEDLYVALYGCFFVFHEIDL